MHRMHYMKHAPEAYFAEDAARVAASLQGLARSEHDTARERGARCNYPTGLRLECHQKCHQWSILTSVRRHMTS
jgi:hypothetical protein